MPEKTYHGYNWECKLLTRPILIARFLTDCWIFISFGGGGIKFTPSNKSTWWVLSVWISSSTAVIDGEIRGNQRYRTETVLGPGWCILLSDIGKELTVSVTKKKKIEFFIWTLNADSGTSKYWCMKDIS